MLETELCLLKALRNSLPHCQMFTGSTIDIRWMNIECTGLLYIYELEIQMNLTVWLLWVCGCLWMQLNVSELVNTVSVIDALSPFSFYSAPLQLSSHECKETWPKIFVMWCFVGAKFGVSQQKIIVTIRQEFEERKPFLKLLRMENWETIKKNFNGKLVQANPDIIIKKVVTKYKILHDVVSCKRLCFHVVDFLFRNEDKIINFCSLNKSNCKTNFDQQVLEDLTDKNYQHVLNIGGFLVRTHEKCNAFISTIFHRCLTWVLNVILTDEHNYPTILY